jgi:hypothetical protein
VPTIASSAERPVNGSVVGGRLSSSIPIGAKAGMMVRPMAASTAWSLSALSKLPSVPHALRKVVTTPTEAITLRRRR